MRDESPSRTLAIVVGASVETVSVVVAAAAPDTVTDAGAKLHAAFIGNPVQEKFTVPPKPATPFTLTCVVTDWPAATVSEVELAACPARPAHPLSASPSRSQQG